jgi:hypothetical protein
MKIIFSLLIIISIVLGIIGIMLFIIRLRDKYLIKKHGKEWLNNHDYGITC